MLLVTTGNSLNGREIKMMNLLFLFFLIGKITEYLRNNDCYCMTLV